MLITLDRHSGVPAYRQIMDQIRFLIASGLLAAGDELPSTRALSADLGTNPMTISKAYGQLERDGLLERRPGLSLIVATGDESETTRGAEARRDEELRRAMEPAAAMAKRLGISRQRATELFGLALDGSPDDESEGRRPNS